MHLTPSIFNENIYFTVSRDWGREREDEGQTSILAAVSWFVWGTSSIFGRLFDSYQKTLIFLKLLVTAYK